MSHGGYGVPAPTSAHIMGFTDDSGAGPPEPKRPRLMAVRLDNNRGGGGLLGGRPTPTDDLEQPLVQTSGTPASSTNNTQEATSTSFGGSTFHIDDVDSTSDAILDLDAAGVVVSVASEDEDDPILSSQQDASSASSSQDRGGSSALHHAAADHNYFNTPSSSMSVVNGGVCDDEGVSPSPEDLVEPDTGSPTSPSYVDASAPASSYYDPVDHDDPPPPLPPPPPSRLEDQNVLLEDDDNNSSSSCSISATAAAVTLPASSSSSSPPSRQRQLSQQDGSPSPSSGPSLLPISVNHTLNFTLRQTGLPSTVEGNQLSPSGPGESPTTTSFNTPPPTATSCSSNSASPTPSRTPTSTPPVIVTPPASVSVPGPIVSVAVPAAVAQRQSPSSTIAQGTGASSGAVTPPVTANAPLSSTINTGNITATIAAINSGSTVLATSSVLNTNKAASFSISPASSNASANAAAASILGRSSVASTLPSAPLTSNTVPVSVSSSGSAPNTILPVATAIIVTSPNVSAATSSTFLSQRNYTLQMVNSDGTTTTVPATFSSSQFSVAGSAVITTAASINSATSAARAILTTSPATRQFFSFPATSDPQQPRDNQQHLIRLSVTPPRRPSNDGSNNTSDTKNSAVPVRRLSSSENDTFSGSVTSVARRSSADEAGPIQLPSPASGSQSPASLSSNILARRASSGDSGSLSGSAPQQKQNVLLKQLLQNCPSAETTGGSLPATVIAPPAQSSAPLAPPPATPRPAVLQPPGHGIGDSIHLPEAPPVTQIKVEKVDVISNQLHQSTQHTIAAQRPQLLTTVASSVPMQLHNSSKSIAVTAPGNIAAATHISLPPRTDMISQAQQHVVTTSPQVTKPSSIVNCQPPEPSLVPFIKQESPSIKQEQPSSQQPPTSHSSGIPSSVAAAAPIGTPQAVPQKPPTKQEQTTPTTQQAPALTTQTPATSAASKSTKDSSEKKVLSYLDIRRMQLEREPTPPPASSDPKPPRKRPPKKQQTQSSQQQSEPPPPKPSPPKPSPSKKRPKKQQQQRPDEEYETFMEALMQRIRAMPPMKILEPSIKPNYNVCALYGKGNLSAEKHPLTGEFGSAKLSPKHPEYGTYGEMFYDIEPFDEKPAPSSLQTQAPSWGFYNQEFSMKIPGMDRSCELYSPETICYCSSPECEDLDESRRGKLSRFRGLRLITDDDMFDEKNRLSPSIPLLAPVPVRPVVNFDFNFDKSRKSPIVSRLPPAPGHVCVTLTLSASHGGSDIGNVLSNLARILQCAPPATYDVVERTDTPPSQRLGLYRGKDWKDDDDYVWDDKRPRFCTHCDIAVPKSGLRKRTYPSDLDEEDSYFCSNNCYMQFALSNQASSDISLRERVVRRLLDDLVERVVNMEEEEAINMEISLTDIKTEVPDAAKATPEPTIVVKQEIVEAKEMEVDQSPQRNATPEVFSPPAIAPPAPTPPVSLPLPLPPPKPRGRPPMAPKLPLVHQWRNIRWRHWAPETSRPICSYHPIPEKELARLLDTQNITLQYAGREDRRACVLCHGVGDSDSEGPSRLLNCDVDQWVHLNCALWSSDVYETMNGALMNVDTAIQRSRSLLCAKCRRPGATLRCYRYRCPNFYHFPCAQLDKCLFFKDKTMLCNIHARAGPVADVLTQFSVFRRVYVNRDEVKLVAAMLHSGEHHFMRVGSMVFVRLGQLQQHQLKNFHTPSTIYPNSYRVLRMYWNSEKPASRSYYLCSILEEDGKPKFRIESLRYPSPKYLLAEGEEEAMNIANAHLNPNILRVVEDYSPKAAWKHILDPLEKLRLESGAIKVFSQFITGEDLFGLTEPLVLRLIESLPGVDSLADYTFRYGAVMELPLAVNPSGCARTEPRTRSAAKMSHRRLLHTSNPSSRSLGAQQATSGQAAVVPASPSSLVDYPLCWFTGSDANSPYTKQFVHSKASQYRKMKTEWRNNVYLARSKIQGLGLYAARDLEKHTMVIEYIGQLIRNEMAERLERIYQAQNRGIYMFRLDDQRVIDATLSGGLARYANHSCNPNCVAEVVEIERELKILIISNRRIARGEEITYDYKFDLEDDESKIPCLCGAPNCHKWMN